MKYLLFVSCAKGLEYLLEAEVKTLGFYVTKVNPQGVFGEATLETIYQLCIWSRLANRVQLILFSGPASEEQSIYNLCFQYPWETLFSVDKTLAIEFHNTSEAIRNTMFGAQVVKDAIVDYFRKLTQARPLVDKENPQIRLHAHLKKDQLTVSLDLVGYSLHQRGYRSEAGEAPLKETLAAALLIRANWPALAAQQAGFYDPFCGSGTLVIEAAMIATNRAPGLIRNDQAIHHWKGHQPDLWEKIRKNALNSISTPPQLKLIGSDSQAHLISIAKANAERAGVLSLIDFVPQELQAARPQAAHGLLLCNPPYGERLSSVDALIPLYQQLGQIAYTHFQGWSAAFLTVNPMLAKAVGLRAAKQYHFHNGPLECKLYCLTLDEHNIYKSFNASEALSSGAQMLANRLKKNFQHLEKWVKREHISCYRLYDADLPEYAFAIDCYKDFALLQEYQAPASIPVHKAEKRSLEVMQVVPLVLNIPANQVIIKQRKLQKGKNQYEKLGTTKKSLLVEEGAALFKVNLYDYLDTGLFLDHRLLRLKFSELPAGTQFLNCFCYTASASVHAALAGAITTNVDMSATYLRWAQENFELNQLHSKRHEFIQEDYLQWLNTARKKYDVIFLDPPSFSNSKRMHTTLDIQRDHYQLIEKTMRLLNSDGVLYFSTNLRGFTLDPMIESQYQVKDITPQTIDIDFKRNTRIHRCFIFKH